MVHSDTPVSLKMASVRVGSLLLLLFFVKFVNTQESNVDADTNGNSAYLVFDVRNCRTDRPGRFAVDASV